MSNWLANVLSHFQTSHMYYFQVEFRNECGEDEGGLRREFFEILLRQMFISPYFEGILLIAF